MLSKIISRSIRNLGLLAIILFSVFCIFGSIFYRDMHTDNMVTKFLEFTISFDSRFYDYRLQKHVKPGEQSKHVSLVAIDDYSLEKIGVWPMPREKHAQMIKQLETFGAKVIGLDILYPEKAPVCGESNPDGIVSKTLKDFQQDDKRIFLAYTTSNSPQDELKETPVEMMNDTVMTRTTSDVNMHPYKINRYNFPIDEFVATEAGLGAITSFEDPDGVFRRYLMVLNIDTFYFGSLAFNTWEAFTGKKHEVKIFNDGTGELVVDNKKLEINSRGEVKIRYLGSLPYFPTIPLFDLLTAKPGDKKMEQAIKDRIVFVGSTATGAHDMRPSPIDQKMPGVLSHMNVAEMLLNKHFLKPTNDSITYSLGILLLGMFIFLVTQRFGNAFIDLIVLNLIIAGAYLADYHYFFLQGYELKLFYCFFCFIACYVWNTFIKFYEANKEKKQIKGTFARYVAPTIVDEMLKDPDKLHVGGFKRDITCLFSDVRDFTSISEGLTATDLAKSLNYYMGKMTDIVFETRGTLDKYIGDAIVAFWGAPLEIGNHAQYAVEAAITMINTLPSINEEFRKLGRPEFNVGVGLNSGECNVGNMGSDRIFSYTALGDNMNLGSRLEGLCKYYGTQILISEQTLERLEKGTVKVRNIDRVIVKGRTQAVPIYEVLHNWHQMTLKPELLTYYQKGWELFEAKKFQEAKAEFEKILSIWDKDKPSMRLRKLCQKYIETPEAVTEDFNITHMTEK